jgi:two-component system chemotaxis sensor kinase CheA
MNKEDAYRDLFLEEANENFEALNQQLIKLEKSPSNQKVIAEIFRITHTLKGNALGMGYQQIADLTHIMEDIFSAVKEGKVSLDEDFVEQLFRANDKLGQLIESLTSGKKVSYLGLKTKLEVLLRNEIEGAAAESTADDNATKAAERDVLEPAVEPEAEEDSEEKFSDSSNPAPNTEETSEDTSSESASDSIQFNDYIQIPVKKMDEMMNMVGELLIERDKLGNRFEEYGMGRGELDGLKRISSNLHYSIMNARMVQIGFLFIKFHRIARDAAFAEKKKVKLVLEGTDVEVDRNILKSISDALVHLVRNAISHGIEKGDERKKAGKEEEGVVTLSASFQKDNIRISISDDGKGMSIDKIKEKVLERKMATAEELDRMDDQQIFNHIFLTGFSSAEKVTEISGRGVGMDIVKQSIESVGGQIALDTLPGLGSQFHLTIPSSLAIKSALLFKVQDQEYAIPMAYTEAVFMLHTKELKRMNHQFLGDFQGEMIPFVQLSSLLESKADTGELFSKNTEVQSIIVSHGGKLTGLIIDQLLQQKEIVEKALPKPIQHVRFVSGTTLLGNGKVCPVIDVSAVSEAVFRARIAQKDVEKVSHAK